MKKIIVVKNEPGKPALLFADLAEASSKLGVSVSTVSRMIADGSIRYADRVFAIKVDPDGWLVAVMNCRNTCYVVLGSQPERLVPRRYALEVRDITASWHAI